MRFRKIDLDLGGVPRELFDKRHRWTYAEVETNLSASDLKDIERAPYRIVDPLKNFIPNAGQMKMFRAAKNALYLSVFSGRQGGKTDGGGNLFFDRMYEDFEDKIAGTGKWAGQGPAAPWRAGGKNPIPFLHYWVVAPQYKLLAEAKSKLQSLLGLIEQGGLIVKQPDNQFWLVGGILIEFMSAEDPKNLVSRALNGIWLDEVTRMKEAAWVDHLQPALAAKKAWVIATTSPFGRNWAWRYLYCPGNYEEACILAEDIGCKPEDVMSPLFRSVTWWTEENDRVPLLREMIEVHRKTMPKAMFDRNYRASFDAFQGQCFDTLDTETHIKIPPTAKFKHIWGGQDWGFRHPGVFAVVGQTHQDEYYLIDYVKRSGMLKWDPSGYDKGEETCWAAVARRMTLQYSCEKVFIPHDDAEGRNIYNNIGLPIANAFLEHSPRLSFFQTGFHQKKIFLPDRAAYADMAGIQYPDLSDYKKNHDEDWIPRKDDLFSAFSYALTLPITQFARTDGREFIYRPY